MQRRTLLALQSLVLLAACDTGRKRTTPPCPPCQCNCTGTAANATTNPTNNNPGTTNPTNNPPPTSPAGDDQATTLLTSANRKFAHKDGPGCLADLDRLTALRPAYASSTATTRAFCEMLSGQCKAGKARLDRYWREEQNMHPERAATTTETMAAMYCRGGDSTDRDRLLGALLDISMGMSETHTLAQCEASYGTIRQLKDRIKPNGPDDHQLLNLGSSLYATAPQCFARAGDCKRARAVFLESYPAERLAEIKPEQRSNVLQTTFTSIVARCK